ncbi:hypothetical protein Rcae01_01723 [Novipirellula caenicola]|uniref:Uncharacterized protein n=1 Tax=Novipirellula caenicola TaxID=1536901 RepID=A0ABP9VNM4_9BACT
MGLVDGFFPATGPFEYPAEPAGGSGVESSYDLTDLLLLFSLFWGLFL